jgi:hypothetical protein
MIRHKCAWLGLCAAWTLAGCHGGRTSARVEESAAPAATLIEAPSAAHATPPAPIDLPPGWRALAREPFERALETSFSASTPHSLTPAALAELSEALQSSDETAVRAVAWLARADDARAVELLFARLERRRSESALEPGPATAIDFAAAAALFRSATPGENGLRIEELATGKNKHPDLDVRVECARGALHAGRDGPVAFLLAVLRTGTTLSGARIDGVAGAELAWCQARAAAALAARAELPARFRPEAALAERERALQELEAALAPRRGNRGQ